MIEGLTLEQVALPLGAAIGLFIVYTAKQYGMLGPGNRYWAQVRSTVWPLLDELFKNYGGFAENHSKEEEYAGSFEVGIDEIEQNLSTVGYFWGIIAGLKTDPFGTVEIASWTKREAFHPMIPDIFAKRQTHATFFRRTLPDGRVVIDSYLHDEKSSIHPKYAKMHYRAMTQDAEKGIADFTEDIGETELELLDLWPENEDE